ncbi:AraC family transcriptional regulator [Paenibacillus yanchengensis]|uniref:AraC family transcriptional regulator n=1 Tax=Paenibacillus yanchengensis TaxID=2035833 RepID=A0ABW4YFR7_9BACL
MLTDTHLKPFKQTVPIKNSDFRFNIFHIIPPTREVMHLHWHEEWELIYMIKGNTAFHIGTETYYPEPGDLLFVNKGLMHTGFAIDDTSVEYFAFVFHSSVISHGFADNYQENDHIEITSPLMMGQQLVQTHISKNAANYTILISLLEQLITEYSQKQHGYRLAIRSLLHLLLVQFSRFQIEDRQEGQTGGIDEDSYEQFKQLFTYIETHYMEKLTIKTAASLVNMSESHFCRSFKKITGKTFVEYVNLHRISIAAQMLETTSLPITEIAFSIGYNSINYFSKLFKMYKHCSPSHYRNE